jgi:putative transcriptional regulator
MNHEMFNELVKSVKEAGQIKRGELKPSRTFTANTIDVKVIREQTGLSQTQLAALMGISRRTLQHWETGRRQPQGTALALLTVFQKATEPAVQALIHRVY